MKKKYKLGICIGRYQMVHRGHSQVLEKAGELCEKVAVFVGSSQEEGTAKNPFSYELRKRMILDAAERLGFTKENFAVYPLPDAGLGNNSKWGAYVLKKVQESCGRLPEVLFSGDESRRASWLEDSWGIDEVFIPKSIEISSTAMREYLAEGKKEEWEKYIDPALIPMYDQLRPLVLAGRDVLETKSI